MKVTFCDECSETINGLTHFDSILPHPRHLRVDGRPRLVAVDLCQFCSSELLTAYANGDTERIDRFWDCRDKPRQITLKDFIPSRDSDMNDMFNRLTPYARKETRR